MNTGVAAQQVGDFAKIYSDLHGQRAHEEALSYALVARSMGDRQEYDFWLSVAEELYQESLDAADAA